MAAAARAMPPPTLPYPTTTTRRPAKPAPVVSSTAITTDWPVP
jgi:hypothetical protein